LYAQKYLLIKNAREMNLTAMDTAVHQIKNVLEIKAKDIVNNRNVFDFTN
jgi:hypothetical protein